MREATAHTYANEVFEEEVSLLRTLARIPAPTGHEDARAAFVANWLRAQGAERVETDGERNVLCWLGETAQGKDIEVFSAHTDVVFDDEGELPLVEGGGRMYAPGIGDDTANLVGLLLATRWLLRHPEATAGRSLLVVANSCEEGLDNLAGTRALYERLGKQIRSHVVFDTRLGFVVSEAVGSLRWRVCIDGPGGHSFKDYGRPNAIVELSRLICALEDLEACSGAAITHNVGTIEGGTTVNAIASHAEMLFELRSVDGDALEAAAKEVERLMRESGREGVRLSFEVVGRRPGNGRVDPVALAALRERALNITRSFGNCDEVVVAPSSTDANIPLSLGIPAVCMGAIRGAGAHTRDEWIETKSLKDGLAVILGMMCADTDI